MHTFSCGHRLGALALVVVISLTSPLKHTVARAATGGSPAATVPVDGPAFAASLVAVAEDGTVTLRVDGQPRKIAAADLVMWGAPGEARRGPQVVTADGSLLVGDRVRFDQDAVRLDAATASSVMLPRNVVRGVILKPSADRLVRRRLRTQAVARQRDSDQLILINGDRVAGKVTSLDDGEAAIASDLGDVRIPVARVGAILLRSPADTRATGRDAQLLVGLRDGTLLRAKSFIAGSADARAQLVCGIDIAGCANAAVTFLQPLAGRAVYLSDLPESHYRQVPYLTLEWPFRRDQNVLGGRLRCQDRDYMKGLGMHTASQLVYRLEEPFRRFDATVAVDDAAGRYRGSAVFRVTTHTERGWNEAYVSPVLRGGDVPVSVSVDLTAADAIRLDVDTADHGNQLDYANWLNPRLVK